MAFMNWSDEYSVGVALFDKEHQELIALINLLHEKAGAISEDSLREIAGRLAGHTVEHFRHEEQFFDKTGYPRAAMHRAMHENLKNKLQTYCSEIGRKDTRMLAVELLDFLKQALSHHIQGEDKRLGDHLKGLNIR